MWCRSKVFWCLVVVCVEILGCLATLKEGDSGVCVVKISVRKTRTKIVSTTRMCGKKKCTAKRTEHYNVPEKRIVCCNGWQYNVTSDSCSPVCTTGCLGGRCISPEVCHCDPPNYLDPEHKNTCLQPKCDPPCVNAQCDANNTCTCNTDHARFNSTHCLKCSSGYVISDEFKCSPVCDEKCINSECTEPNKCTCLEGYQTGNISNVCEPKCENCINSTCVAPNMCSCLEGYVKLDNATCVPLCEQCDGECVAPEVCNCRSGFMNVDGVCKPVCENCENGVCAAPGECKCNEGFVKNASDPAVCIRNCEQPTMVQTRWSSSIKKEIECDASLQSCYSSHDSSICGSLTLTPENNQNRNPADVDDDATGDYGFNQFPPEFKKKTRNHKKY